MNKHDELVEKSARLTEMLKSQGLGGVLLNAQHNFAWLTAGGRNGVDTARGPGVASLLVRKDGRRFLLASRIEMPRMLSEEVSESDFEPIEFAWEDEKSSPSFLTDKALAVLDSGDALGTDSIFGPGIRPLEGDIAKCRFQLTEAEIRRLSLLGADAGRILGELAHHVKPGETELEIAQLMSTAFGNVGAHAQVLLVAADDRIDRFRHPVPTDKPWRHKVMLVVCARRGGLIVSLTRIVSAGPISDDLRRKTDAAAYVNARLIEATKPGFNGAELYEVAARAYQTQGFPDEIHLHHQGGACGYKPREWTAHPLSKDVVVDSQAFAWNPSITGTKVEETVLIRDGVVESITASQDWPYLEVEIDGAEFLSPDILTL
jgi:antitoxin VapB